MLYWGAPTARRFSWTESPFDGLQCVGCIRHSGTTVSFLRLMIIVTTSWPGSPGEQRGESNVGEGESVARRGRGERNEKRKSAEDEQPLGIK